MTQSNLVSRLVNSLEIPSRVAWSCMAQRPLPILWSRRARRTACPPVPLNDSIAEEAGIVHEWQLGPLTALHYGSDPVYAERPQDPKMWKPIRSERFGVRESQSAVQRF